MSLISYALEFEKFVISPLKKVDDKQKIMIGVYIISSENFKIFEQLHEFKYVSGMKENTSILFYSLFFYRSSGALN